MKILRLIFCGLLTFCICFTCLYGYKKIPESNIKTTEEYKGILTLWQVDTFEGGTSSRRQFLLGVARQYERLYPGVLVMVKRYTIDSYNNAVMQGETPDMLSFGAGIKIDGATELPVKDGLNGGLIGNKQYAVSWCRGGYVFIVNNTLCQSELPSQVTVSIGQYNQTEIALLESGKTFSNVQILPQEQAYMQFVTGKTPCLLGTQRDIYRLKNRDIPISVYPVEGYNDLFQYISVLTTDDKKYGYSVNFINLLLSEKIQTKLSSIGLLSVNTKVNYDDENMAKLQKISSFKTISAFCGKDYLINLNQLSNSALQGNAVSVDKIKKLLI